MLSFQRRLIELRQREPALSVGSYAPAGIASDAFAFVREHAGGRLLVAVNLGHRPVVLKLEQVTVAGEVLLGTHAEREGKRLDGPIELHGDEGIVLRLAA